MKFLGFSKIWDEILKIYFISKFFFFLEKYIWREKSIPILENPKNFMILFFHPLNLGRNLFLLEKISTRFQFDSITFSNFKISMFKKHFFLQISFITSLVTSKINVGSNLLNCPRSAENAPNDNPVAFGLYSLQSF